MNEEHTKKKIKNNFKLSEKNVSLARCHEFTGKVEIN
jgi:hypothetical protein